MTSAFICLQLPSPPSFSSQFPWVPIPDSTPVLPIFPQDTLCCLLPTPGREVSGQLKEGEVHVQERKHVKIWATEHCLRILTPDFRDSQGEGRADVQKERNLKSVLPLIPLDSTYWNRVCHVPLKVLPAWEGQ